MRYRPAHPSLNAMNDPLGSNDPLDPIYRQDVGAPQPVKRIGKLGSRTNLAVLIALIALMLALYVVIGPDKTVTPTAPAQIENDLAPKR